MPVAATRTAYASLRRDVHLIRPNGNMLLSMPRRPRPPTVGKFYLRQKKKILSAENNVPSFCSGVAITTQRSRPVGSQFAG